MKSIAYAIMGGLAMIACAILLAFSPWQLFSITVSAIVALLCFMAMASAKE